MTSSICESMLKSPGNDMLFGTSQIDQSDDDEKQRYEEELENLNQQIDDKNDELQVQLLELMQNVFVFCRYYNIHKILHTNP